MTSPNIGFCVRLQNGTFIMNKRGSKLAAQVPMELLGQFAGIIQASGHIIQSTRNSYAWPKMRMN